MLFLLERVPRGWAVESFDREEPRSGVRQAVNQPVTEW